MHLVANVCRSVCGVTGSKSGLFFLIRSVMNFITTVVSLGLIGVFFVVVNTKSS